ncbi:3-oxoacyl-[acyl-carrier-protein] synthase III C-terminal domain-containing protein [Streptomyces sp. NPDC021096]|uniref:3-oxoacyl-ACP synthase III family protein n=1 Tax=Streptomyces sp. NPDC021096 TaxID=3154792 RepID=UPI0033C7979A
MPHMRACLAGVAAHLPETWISTTEREAQIAAASPGFSPPAGLLTQMTGVEGVHLIGEDQQASDLAVSAAQKLLADQGTKASDIDLMIFAAASQDMAEPATSHIVAAKLGLKCPVFDVKNACNSVLNAIEITQALIASGQYRTVLITCGEALTAYTRLRIPHARAFAQSLPSYGFSDAGCALLWTAEEATKAGPVHSRGVIASRFAADSTAWASATVRTGGTRSAIARSDAQDDDAAYFRMDSTHMRESVRTLALTQVRPLMNELDLAFEDFAFIGVHQVALADLAYLCGPEVGIPRDKLVITLPRHGNVASASLPLQLSCALESGMAHPGDLIVLIGLAAGSSAGAVIIRL